MKKFLLGLLILAIAVSYSIYSVHQPRSLETTREELIVTKADGQTHSFTVEVARTNEQIRDGLMFRTSMPPDAGMLFLLPVPQEVRFWMKNTLIPLDMLFIRPDGVVAKVHANAQPQDLTPIPSGEVVAAVIEINGGRAAQLGIVAGSRVSSASFNPKVPQ